MSEESTLPWTVSCGDVLERLDVLYVDNADRLLAARLQKLLFAATKVRRASQFAANAILASAGMYPHQAHETRFIEESIEWAGKDIERARGFLAEARALG